MSFFVCTAMLADVIGDLDAQAKAITARLKAVHSEGTLDGDLAESMSTASRQVLL